MWYVIQTFSGNEAEVKRFIEAGMEPGTYRKCIVPIYEEVRRRGGRSHILFRKLFPGYLFVDTDEEHIGRVDQILRKYPEFTRVLSIKEKGEIKIFTPIDPAEEKFLEMLIGDGILHVSYVETEKNSKKIKKITGPLGRFRNNIVRMSTSSREAIVDITMFGIRHKIRFGLWNEEDARLPIFEPRRDMEEETPVAGDEGSDTGIHPGDIVKGISEPYEGYSFIVEKVNPSQRKLSTTIELFGDKRHIELFLDQVEKEET